MADWNPNTTKILNGQVVSFPSHYSMNTQLEAYELRADNTWPAAGTSYEYEPTGAFDGTPCIKVFPPTVDQSYLGLGSFLLPVGTSVVSLRFKLYHGADYFPNIDQNKLLIIHDITGDPGDRPMSLLKPADGVKSYGACHGTLCKFESSGPEDFWPNTNEAWNGLTQGANRWIDFEILVDRPGGTIKVFIHQDDGVAVTQGNNPWYAINQVDDVSLLGSFLESIQVIGGYQNFAFPASPEGYLKFSHISISDQYQGPIQGIDMAFPIAVSEAYRDSVTTIKSIKAAAQSVITRSNTGTMKANAVIELSKFFADSLDKLNIAKATLGIADYARAQHSDQSLDIVVEYNAVVNEVQLTIDWIFANFPTAGGYVQRETLGADGRITQRVLSAAQTSGLRTQLTALLATIE